MWPSTCSLVDILCSVAEVALYEFARGCLLRFLLSLRHFALHVASLSVFLGFLEVLTLCAVSLVLSSSSTSMSVLESVSEFPLTTLFE